MKTSTEYLNWNADVPKNIEEIKKKFESINKGISEFNKLIENGGILCNRLP